MAVKMVVDQEKFCSMVSPNDTVKTLIQGMVTTLLVKKWVFGFSMFMVTINHSEKKELLVASNMPAMITAILAGSVTDTQRAICASVFTKLLQSALAADAEASASEEAINTAPSTEYDEITEVDPNVNVTFGPAKSVKKTTGTPTPKFLPTVALSAAKALGQQVYGTNPSNLYRVVALGKLNVAVRVVPKTGVSIRLERSTSCKESVTTLFSEAAKMGFSLKDSYASMHATLNADLPAARVVGAVLFSLNQKFTSVITDGTEL